MRASCVMHKYWYCRSRKRWFLDHCSQSHNSLKWYVSVLRRRHRYHKHYSWMHHLGQCECNIPSVQFRTQILHQTAEHDSSICMIDDSLQHCMRYKLWVYDVWTVTVVVCVLAWSKFRGKMDRKRINVIEKQKCVKKTLNFFNKNYCANRGTENGAGTVAVGKVSQP